MFLHWCLILASYTCIIVRQTMVRGRQSAAIEGCEVSGPLLRLCFIVRKWWEEGNQQLLRGVRLVAPSSDYALLWGRRWWEEGNQQLLRGVRLVAPSSDYIYCEAEDGERKAISSYWRVWGWWPPPKIMLYCEKMVKGRQSAAIEGCEVGGSLLKLCIPHNKWHISLPWRSA